MLLFRQMIAHDEQKRTYTFSNELFTFRGLSNHNYNNEIAIFTADGEPLMDVKGVRFTLHDEGFLSIDGFCTSGKTIKEISFYFYADVVIDDLVKSTGHKIKWQPSKI